jgi:alcohol dehydrogenase class IV
MKFEFSTAANILFGPGSIRGLGKIVRGYGRRISVLTGIPREYLSLIETILEADGLEFMRIPVVGEPSVEAIRAAVEIARQFQSEIVIGIGGGSALDSAKAIAVLLTNPGDVLDYLEIVGRGLKLNYPGLPFVAIPTTSGTGSEVTKNAVLGAEVPGQVDRKVKVSLRSPLMLAKQALIDPELTLSLPPGVTAATGLDALTQLIEPFVSNLANPITDAICREGIKFAARSLRIAYHDGANYQAREDMALASLFGGLSLANAKLGAVHGFAGVIGGMYSIPHGVVCARLLPYVIEVNIRALRERAPDGPAIYRYGEIARLVTGSEHATPEDACSWVHDLLVDFDVSSLSVFGIQKSELRVIVEQAAGSSSMQGNPIKLTRVEMEEILGSAL